MSAGNVGNGRIAQPILQKNLGLRIVALRRSKGWSQGDLADRLGIDRSRLGKWERGLYAPSLEELAFLASLLGATLDELVLGRESPPALLPPDQREQLAMFLGGLTRLVAPLTGRTGWRKK
jgi:transcriptional regulator with XRE-family HTH domain